MALVAVTGGIGAGKTSLLRVLAELGQPTVDADDLVHELYRTDTMLKAALASRWGQAVFDRQGNPLRPAIAARVFGSERELKWLNEQLHPRVRTRLRREAERHAGPLFAAVPLLFEAGWQDDADLTVAVWCPRQVRLQRLRTRGWTADELARREQHQWTAEDKLAAADVGIVNSGTPELLRRQCELLVADCREP